MDIPTSFITVCTLAVADWSITVSYLVLIPILAAIIGWGTNHLAVKMLFHPKEPISLAGFTVQGVFPKRQNQLAEKLGSLVSEELFSVSDISERIENFATSCETMKAVERRIEKTIREKLVGAFPMLTMFLTDDMIQKITRLFKSELEDFMKQSASELSDQLENNLDVREIVRKKVLAFSSDKLEQLLFELMKKEFRFIELVGAVLGFTIGCAQVLLVVAFEIF